MATSFTSLFGRRQPAYHRVSTREDQTSPVPGATHHAGSFGDGRTATSPGAYTTLLSRSSPSGGGRGPSSSMSRTAPPLRSAGDGSSSAEGPRWTKVLLLTMAAMGLAATATAALRTVQVRQSSASAYGVREPGAAGLQQELVPPGSRPLTAADKRALSKRDKFCSKVAGLLKRYPAADSPSEKGGLPSYPLTPQHFNQSYHPGGAKGGCHLQRLFRRMVWPDGKDIVVDVLGTSMTAGNGCKPESQCAWPYRLQQWLTRSFPRLPLVVRNRADSDATIKDYAEKGHSSWWGEWKAGHVDLLLTDLTISHQGFREGVYPADSDVGVGEVKKWTRLFLDRLVGLGDKAPSLVMLKTFRLSRTKEDCMAHCPSDDMRLKKARLGEPGLCWCKWWWRMGDWDREELHDFQVPEVSYRDAVWPDQDSVDARMRTFFWAGESNPTSITHRLVADTVGYGLLRLLHDQCESGHVMQPQDAQTCMDERRQQQQQADAPAPQKGQH